MPTGEGGNRTEQLRDPGEEEWPIKLHVGCGTVYLTGYINIDAQGEVVAKDDPVIVFSEARTTIDRYYRYPFSIKDGCSRVLRVRLIDTKSDIRRQELPYEPATVDKIVALQFLEHLSPVQVRRALAYFWSLLRPGGVLVLSVPELEGTLKMLAHPVTKAFASRHMLGTEADQFSMHRSWWREADFVEQLDEVGFACEMLSNPHDYPAIAVRATKLPLRWKAREYRYTPRLPEGTTVLDIGPGLVPHPAATYWVDVVPHPELELPGEVYSPKGGLPFGSGAFDYAVLSHVLEHCPDPLALAREAGRVANAGYIEVPTAIRDWVFQWGHMHRRWIVSGRSGLIVFVERQGYDRHSWSRSDIGGKLLAVARDDNMALTADQIAWRELFKRSCYATTVIGRWGHGQSVRLEVYDKDGGHETCVLGGEETCLS